MLLAFGPWCETAIRPRLLTTKLLDLAYPGVTQSNQGNALRYSTDGRSTLAPEVDGTVRVWGPDPAREARFESIGHSLAALLLAVFGGFSSRYFYDHRDERRREAAEKAAGILLKLLEAGL